MCTHEIAEASLIEDIIKQTVSEAAALALDSVVFGAQADNGAVPQGLLNGVTARTGVTGGGVNALSGDSDNCLPTSQPIVPAETPSWSPPCHSLPL